MLKYLEKDVAGALVSLTPLADTRGALDDGEGAIAFQTSAPAHAGGAPPTEQAAAGQAEDVRTLPVQYEKTGERYRNFDDAVLLMHEEEFDEGDWPLDGPRSAF